MRLLEFRAMNTTVQMVLEAPHGADEGLRMTQAFIEDCERRLSRFLPESELSRLNSAPGRWVAVSGDLLELLVLSKAYFEETRGLFDPSILPDLKRAGYDVSMDEVRKRQNQADTILRRAERRRFDEVEIDVEQGRIRLPPGLEIDLGGIAKGWIVQRSSEMLRAHGNAAAVNAGGDMYFSGTPTAADKWQVEIEDPRDPTRTLAVLAVGEGAVVTSSISKRSWRQGGEQRHHIIDPRTGEPARANWLSATVIAPHADLAEAYAKAFLIGGQQEARRLMLQRPRIAVLCIGADGHMFASANFREYMNDSNQLLS